MLTLFALAAGALAAGGCGNLLDVENPNNLIQENLEDPAAAAPLVNGASGTLIRGIGAMMGPYATATDEVFWIGSRDAWREIDFGFFSDQRNEFSDDAFRYINEGRFMADEAIRRLEAFDQAGTLDDRNLLASAYLYGAIAYVTIADMFDRFVISDRREVVKVYQADEMVQFYQQAIEYINQGLAIAKATDETDLQTRFLAMRARAYYSIQLWQVVNPAGQIADDVLVSSTEATQDALVVIETASPEFRYVLTLSNDDIAYAGEVSLFYNVNQRGELGVSPLYGTLGRTPEAALKDPITGEPDPVLDRELNDLAKVYVSQPITIVSYREMLLILAEAALARDETESFAQYINRLRGLDNLPPYTGQIPPIQMLEHARRVNLFLQGRRLADQYRFGVPSPQWQPNSPAMQMPGTFFPITCIEIRTHPEDFPDVSC